MEDSNIQNGSVAQPKQKKKRFVPKLQIGESHAKPDLVGSGE